MPNQIPKEKQLEAAIRIVAAVGRAVRELCLSRPDGYPSGELYARLMNRLSAEQYDSVIDTLKRVGLIEEKNYLLIWIDPPEKVEESHESHLQNS